MGKPKGLSGVMGVMGSAKGPVALGKLANSMVGKTIVLLL
jgi:hypothetical protein